MREQRKRSCEGLETMIQFPSVLNHHVYYSTHNPLKETSFFFGLAEAFWLRIVLESSLHHLLSNSEGMKAILILAGLATVVGSCLIQYTCVNFDVSH